MSECSPPDETCGDCKGHCDPCNPVIPLLTADECREALEHKFPDPGVELRVYPGMEPIISWLVFHENMLKEGGLLPGCIPELESEDSSG